MAISKTHKSEYGAWTNMRHRCFNTNHPQYQDYGGRGIKVCDAWKDDFLQFLKDVGAKPSPELTLDRLNNDGNYEPGNVAWRSRSDQQKNKRKLPKKSDHLLSHNGKTQSLGDWANELGMNRSTLQERLRSGWSISDALTTPVRSYS